MINLQNKSKKGNLEGISHEVDLYIKHIKERFGRFEYAPFKTPYDPRREEEQIKILYPKCSLPFELGPLDHTLRRRKRTYSFSGSERDSTTGTPTPSDIEDNNGGGSIAPLLSTESQISSDASDTKGTSIILLLRMINEQYVCCFYPQKIGLIYN